MNACVRLQRFSAYFACVSLSQSEHIFISSFNPPHLSEHIDFERDFFLSIYHLVWCYDMYVALAVICTCCYTKVKWLHCQSAVIMIKICRIVICSQEFLVWFNVIRTNHFSITFRRRRSRCTLLSGWVSTCPTLYDKGL